MRHVAKNQIYINSMQLYPGVVRHCLFFIENYIYFSPVGVVNANSY